MACQQKWAEPGEVVMGNAEHQKGPNTEARLLPKPHRTMRRTANHAGLDSKVELEPAV